MMKKKLLGGKHKHKHKQSVKSEFGGMDEAVIPSFAKENCLESHLQP